MSTHLPFDYTNCTALVTGASRGIGAEIARELARRGIPRIALVARNAQDLDALAQELHDSYEIRAEVIVADLSDSEKAPAAIKVETDRLGLHVDLLVNNAGFGDYGYFDTCPLSKQESMIDVNVASLVALTRLYLPAIVEEGRGGIINVASTAGFQPVPFMATYGATKAFVLSFSEALWAENRERGNDVRVVCLCPGGTETNFRAVSTAGSSEGRGEFERTPQSTPEEVAKAGLDALDNNASYVVPGLLNYLGTFGARLGPRAAVARVTAAMFRPIPQSTTPRTGNREKLLRLTLTGAAIAGTVAAVVMLIRRERD